MNTRFSMVLPGVDALAGETLADETKTLLETQERLMSRFDEDGPLAELNCRAGSEPVAPPAPLWDILLSCRDHWRRTGGAFDITQTARTELWRQAARRSAPPSARELSEAANRCGFHNVQFDAQARTVRFAVPGLQLDLGAIGKGLALELVAQVLRRRGVRCAFLSFGESSIAVIGPHPSGQPWPLGVADLFEPGRSWHRFQLNDAAMSTSGNRTEDGHIVNPGDGQLISGPRTLSVACPSAIDAEVLSTALLVVPVAQREDLLRRYPGTQAVEIVYEPYDNGWTGKMKWHHES
jgi:thiamine biosynthesis lipoprotein